MKKTILSLVLMFILVISGCVTGSKVVKPSSNETGKSIPAIDKKSLSETPAAVSINVLKGKNITEAQAGDYNKPIETVTQVASTKAGAYPVLKSKSQPPKIQYSQIVKLISEFIDMKENRAISGENNYVGISENKLTIFEIKGNKDNIKEESMKLIYPKGIDKSSVELNNAMMSRFLRNAAPELQNWRSLIKDILNKFYSMKVGVQGVTEEDMELDNKIIKILYDRNADYIVVTLKPLP